MERAQYPCCDSTRRQNEWAVPLPLTGPCFAGNATLSSSAKGGALLPMVSIVSRVALVLLFSLVTTGCTNFFFKRGPQPVTPGELPKAQTEPRGGSVSDRLRDDVARGSRAEPVPEPPRTLQPTQAPAPPQPQPAAAPAAVAPVQNGVEPDPRAVIDWLLKERR